MKMKHEEGWMMLKDKRYNEVLKPKMPEGFILIKEWQKWGECPTIKNYANGQVLFWLHGAFVQPKVMLADLLECWRPAARDEREWAINRMESELNGAQQTFQH